MTKRELATLDVCPSCAQPVRRVDVDDAGATAEPCGHRVEVTVQPDGVVELAPFVTEELEDPEPGQPALPGLDPAPRGSSALDKATRRTLVALQAAGKIGEREAMVAQLMLDLAVVVDAGRRQGKAAAAAMAATQLLAAYTLLTADESEGGGNDAFDELARDLRSAGARAMAELRGSGSAVRDSAES